MPPLRPRAAAVAAWSGCWCRCSAWDCWPSCSIAPAGADLEQAFRRIGWPTFALLVVLGAVEQVIDCEALRRAMLGRVGLAWTMASNAAGGLVNTVVPFEAGEVVKGALLRQRSTHSRVVSGLIVWNYAWKLAKPAAVATCFVLGVALGHVFRKDLQLPVLAGVVLSFLPYLATAAAAPAAPGRAADAPAGPGAAAQAAGAGWGAGGRPPGRRGSQFLGAPPGGLPRGAGADLRRALRGRAGPLSFRPAAGSTDRSWQPGLPVRQRRRWSTTRRCCCQPGWA